MTACEYCWTEAHRRGIEYQAMMRLAEQEHLPCCELENGEPMTLTQKARRLRAGQFWDEETKRDIREHRSC